MPYWIGIILFIAGTLLGAIIVWFLRQREISSIRKTEDELKDAFSSLSREALDSNQKSFFELARNQFENLTKSSGQQLDEKKKLIDSSIKEMKSHLENLAKQTTELKGQMENSQQGISRLTDTTSKLRQILSSSQARGQWGERMVEDILNFIGLVEGKNYIKQSQEGTDRPDYTFYLPQEKHVNMDVKFPLSHYENYISAESDTERNSEKKQFMIDVRNHVKEIAKRSYIDPEGGTVDYVLMFIPNESIYTFLNQEDNELIDFSLENKIILCSPITLYAVLSLIRQAVSSFAMERRAGDMQKLIGLFSKQWQMFVSKMDGLGDTLGTLQKKYEELHTTRVRQLEKPMDKINELQLDQPKEIKE
ncbi:MAG: DNA recombination protein RmuC [Candidatus Neomarinimicrobiota bacterium]